MEFSLISHQGGSEIINKINTKQNSYLTKFNISVPTIDWIPHVGGGMCGRTNFLLTSCQLLSITIDSHKYCQTQYHVVSKYEKNNLINTNC